MTSTHLFVSIYILSYGADRYGFAKHDTIVETVRIISYFHLAMIVAVLHRFWTIVAVARQPFRRITPPDYGLMALFKICGVLALLGLSLRLEAFLVGLMMATAILVATMLGSTIRP